MIVGMNSTTLPADGIGRDVRRVYSTIHTDGYSPNYTTRIYTFGLHKLEIHTHIGRYVSTNNRVQWCSMTMADLIFTNIERREIARALWGYRHDSSLTITELKMSKEAN